ncbi:hypothetical protein Dimus_026710 [Dionaea muscipula]
MPSIPNMSLNWCMLFCFLVTGFSFVVKSFFVLLLDTAVICLFYPFLDLDTVMSLFPSLIQLKREERNVRRTALNSLVGTLDICHLYFCLFLDDINLILLNAELAFPRSGENYTISYT